MKRFQYKTSDFYEKKTRVGGSVDTHCDVCGKPIKPNGVYYETILTQGTQAFIELAEIEYDIYMKLEDHRFCSPKCIKKQLANYSDKTIEDYNKLANEKILKLSKEEYEEYEMQGFLY